MSYVIGGWQLSTLLVAQTGLPYTPGLSANTLNSTGGNRPDRIGNGNLPRGERSPDRWFDKSAFATPALYVFGNSGSNIIETPGVANFDTTLSRTFRLSERFVLDFRTEFFFYRQLGAADPVRDEADILIVAIVLEGGCVA